MSNKVMKPDEKGTVVLKEGVKKGCRGGGEAEGEDGRLGRGGIGIGVECVGCGYVMMMGWFEEI
jgi:hypothetical protein